MSSSGPSTKIRRCHPHAKSSASALLIGQSNNARYAGLKQQQSNKFFTGDDRYTDTMVVAKTLLEDWQGGASKQKSRETGVMKQEEGVAFVQGGTEKKKPYIHPDLVCHGCGEKGHCLSNCTSTPAAAKEAIMAAKQAAWAAKKGVVATNIEAEIPENKEEVDDGIPTYE